ncbi:Cryptochrome DASH [Vibrio thalassae]|uniref:Cryptochrome DASH n=1 Tax=Vibrio thalassae TaxID=1243014 RepID=A0A240EHH4_9VIBR|nr:DASH family cryptochrome [Vibrio thalassae]SNX48158.1 Cryptochrome DASH [Vibrio thalassae]
MSNKRGIYWFTQDLRLHDNLLLQHASEQVDRLHCVCFDELKSVFDRRFLPIEIDDSAKREFTMQSLGEFNQSLMQLGQVLHYVTVNSLDDAVLRLEEMITYYSITDIYVAHSASWYVDYVLTKTILRHPKIAVHRAETASLFSQALLPFDIEDLPASFSRFRKQVENILLPIAGPTTTQLPPPLNNRDGLPASYGCEPSSLKIHHGVRGGELAGLGHVRDYFSTTAALHYKSTRNELDNWDSSTKFSLWLANGNVSAKMILSHLNRFERQHGSNESTHWILFELLWREYFHWYSHKHGAKLFAFGGIQGKRPLTTFYANRLRQWVEGNTPFPIVNACMNQLRETGYMSNRGRQLVASCLVHELSLDWRYGACYFQHMLIDYDVGSNWGNWQYLAGVGADPRGHRKFDLSKQTQLYDPENVFIRKWKGDQPNSRLNAVDMVDWPIQD